MQNSLMKRIVSWAVPVFWVLSWNFETKWQKSKQKSFLLCFILVLLGFLLVCQLLLTNYYIRNTDVNFSAHKCIWFLYCICESTFQLLSISLEHLPWESGIKYKTLFYVSLHCNLHRVFFDTLLSDCFMFKCLIYTLLSI